MFKVLIADDNAITRKSIILTVDWSSLCCKVIADADNGITALALTQKYNPDIIITDIRMPGMDGLAFTEKAKEINSHVKIIIITGYSEFTYAKEALRLGAFNLAVKPIDSDELSETLKKAVATLKEETAEKSQKAMLVKTVNKNRKLIAAKSIIDVLDGHLESVSLDYDIKKFFVFTSKYKSSNIDVKTAVSDRNNEAKHGIESLHQKYDFEIIDFWFNGLFTVLILEKCGKCHKLFAETAKELCGYFIKEGASVFNDSCKIGVSRFHTNINELKSAYDESIDSLDFSFYSHTTNIVFAETAKNKGVISENALIKKLYDPIKDSNPAQIETAINEIREILVSETPSVKSVKNLASNICSIALDFYYSTKGYQYYTFKSHSEITSEIEAIDDIDMLTSYVHDFIITLIGCPESSVNEKYSKVTLRVIDYLNEHYNKKVSLQEISDYVSLTPSYLSRVIKKDTGISFVDLFNNIKITMAQKLLKESNLKVYEVANRVGIDNYSYFYQLFKKATGISPSDYYNNRSSQTSIK